jgi:hypothetical protein
VSPLTSAECLAIAERKMVEAMSARRHGKELKLTAQAWMVRHGESKCPAPLKVFAAVSGVTPWGLFLRLPVSNPSSAAKIKPRGTRMFRSKSPIFPSFPPAVLMHQTKPPPRAVH